MRIINTRRARDSRNMLRWLLFDDKLAPRRLTLDSERNSFGWRMRTYDYTFLDDADMPCLARRGRSPRLEVASASYGTFLEEVFFGAPCTADLAEDDETDSDEQELAEWPAALDSEEMSQEMSWRVHMVRRGETLPGLALRYGLTVEDIKRANGLAGDSFGVKTEVNIPNQTGITSANEVLRMATASARRKSRRNIHSQCTAAAKPAIEEEWCA